MVKFKQINIKNRTYYFHNDQIDASEGIDVNKTSASRECDLCHYWFLNMLDLNLKNMFVKDVMIY